MSTASRFLTNTVFRSREDLMTWVQYVARSLGFVIITRRSKTSPIGYVSKIILGCERGGLSRCKSRENTNEQIKDIGSKKTNCPFQLVGKYSKTHNVWELKVVCDEHNHPPALYMDGHAYAMRLSSKETRLVQDLTRLNVKPRNILTTLKEQNEYNVSSLKTVYNARYKFRVTEQAGRTPVQNLMYILENKGYIFEHRQKEITGELEELFFVHPKSLQIWQAFPYVVLMDATYKTNKYNLPFLEIVGVSSTNKTFCIAFGFMSEEKEINYTWALTRLKNTINESFAPRVIVTDEVNRLKRFVITPDNCGCQLRSSFGLPCAHELAMYLGEGLSIPLDCIDPFWTKLDLLPSIDVEYGDLGYDNNMEMYKETFNKKSNHVKSSILRKLKDIFDPSANSIVEPLVKKNNRGRPKTKNVKPSIQEPYRRSCANPSNFDRFSFKDMNKEPARHSSFSIDLNEEPPEKEEEMGNGTFYFFTLRNEIPKIFHPYIRNIQNVEGDGNCGFRAVAVCLGYGENQWLYIRQQLLEELLNAYNAYGNVFKSGINELYTSLLCSSSPALARHWMVMPETGLLIANKFGVILHCLSSQGCVTCFPLWKGPEEFQQHRMITIAHVYGNHYVMVQLDGEYPIPSISTYWVRHKSPSAVGWQTMYMQRLEYYRQLNPCNRGNGFIHIED